MGDALHLCHQFVIEVARDEFMGEWISFNTSLVIRVKPQYERRQFVKSSWPDDNCLDNSGHIWCCVSPTRGERVLFPGVMRHRVHTDGSASSAWLLEKKKKKKKKKKKPVFQKKKKKKKKKKKS